MVMTYTIARLNTALEGRYRVERESSPRAKVPALIWKALREATPILPPRAFVRLGLLGLILVYDYPALRDPSRLEAANTEGSES